MPHIIILSNSFVFFLYFNGIYFTRMSNPQRIQMNYICSSFVLRYWFSHHPKQMNFQHISHIQRAHYYHKRT